MKVNREELVEERSGTLPKIMSAVFVIWFIASIGFMWYFSEVGKQLLILAVAGQYFLVFGIIGICSTMKSKSFHPHLWLFPYLGIGMIAAAVVLQFKISIAGHTPGFICAMLFINVFTLTGICTYIKCAADRKLLRACTFSIQGKCVDLKHHYTITENSQGHRRRIRTICPVYKIVYREQTYHICNNDYTNFMNPKIGEYEKLKINPNDPGSDVFITRRTKLSTGIMLFIGTVCFLAGIIVTIMFMKNGI